MSLQTRIELFFLRLLARIGVGRAREHLRRRRLAGLSGALDLGDDSNRPRS